MDTKQNGLTSFVRFKKLILGSVAMVCAAAILMVNLVTSVSAYNDVPTGGIAETAGVTEIMSHAQTADTSENNNSDLEQISLDENILLVTNTDTEQVNLEELDGVVGSYADEDMCILSFEDEKAAEQGYEQLQDIVDTVEKNVDLKLTDDVDLSEILETEEKEEDGKEIIGKADYKVAVIDTGVTGVSESYDFTGEGTEDLSGHGTAVAALIQACMGSNKTADIISLKAFDKEGHGSLVSLCAAVSKAIELDVDIINLSGISRYKLEAGALQELIETAIQNGIQVVAAAGNSRTDTKYFTPSNMRDVIVVSAVNDDGSFASYSNYGSTVDYSAPGTYDEYTGTSFAGARITGYLIRYGIDGLTPRGVDNGAEGWDRYYGYATLGVDQNGQVPDDSYEAKIFGMDWESMSTDELDLCLRDSEVGELIIWFQSLSKEERERVLSVSKFLNLTTQEFDDDGNVTRSYPYYQHLLEFKLSEFDTAYTFNSKTGYFSLKFYTGWRESNLEATYRIDVTLARADSNANNSVTYAVTLVSGKDRGLTVNKGTYGGTVQLGDNTTTDYTILCPEFTYKKYAYNGSYQAASNAGLDIGYKCPEGSDERFNFEYYKQDGTGDWSGNKIGVNKTEKNESFCISINVHNVGIKSVNSSHTTSHAIGAVVNQRITLDITYGPGTGEGTEFTKTYYYNDNMTLASCPFTKTGYHFTKWDIDTKGASSYTPNDLSPVTDGEHPGKPPANTTLYFRHTLNATAQWNINTYTVKYNGNGATGGSTESSSHTYDTAKNLTKNGFTKTGYTFQGWATTATGTVEYTDQKSVKNLTTTNNGTVTLYAVWKAIDYTVSFNANGGTGKMADQTGSYDKAMNLPTNVFARPTYTFLGWSTDPDAATATYTDKQSVKNLAASSSTVKLYAVWKKTDASFDTSTLIHDENMFTGDGKLVGGAGTTYDKDNVDSQYAHMDDSNDPGYFTRR